MPSSRKRRPQSFDLTPPGGAEPAPSGWTYRSGTEEAPSTTAPPVAPPPSATAAPRTEGFVDWVIWPAEFVFLLLFAPLGARRKR